MTLDLSGKITFHWVITIPVFVLFGDMNVDSVITSHMRRLSMSFPLLSVDYILEGGWDPSF